MERARILCGLGYRPKTQYLYSVMQRCNWVRFASSIETTKTYYDLLGVRRDSNEKEIRQAFVKLSKKLHPDAVGAEGNVKQSEQFVEIMKAYKVLSKPATRSEYDQDLLFHGVNRSQSVAEQSATSGLKTTECHRSWEIHPSYDPNPGAYYGIEGVQRVSNQKIALLLAAIATTVVAFGLWTMRYSFALNQQTLDQKSTAASLHHANVRADALKFGNEEQLRRMANKITKDI